MASPARAFLCHAQDKGWEIAYPLTYYSNGRGSSMTMTQVNINPMGEPELAISSMMRATRCRLARKLSRCSSSLVSWCS